MCVALLGAFVVAAPAKAQFYTQFAAGEWEYRLQQYAEWRTEQGAWYNEYAPVEVLINVYKGGTLNATNGSVQWWSAHPAWSVDFDYGGTNDFWINNDGSGNVEMGLVLTGSRGSKGIPILGLQTGLMRDISLFVDGAWYNLGSALLVTNITGIDPDNQSYLNGVKHNVNTVDNNYDKSLTFVWSEFINDRLGGGEFGTASGGIGVRFANTLRNQNGLAIIAMPGEMPEGIWIDGERVVDSGYYYENTGSITNATVNGDFDNAEGGSITNASRSTKDGSTIMVRLPMQ
jgi:hypothetical protein